MSVFMLECESVSEVGSSLSSLVSKISEISSSVNGYDTSCEDGFDFASAKSSIAANIEACASKVQNTAQLLENVVSSHSSLQASIASGNFSSSSSSATTSTTSASSNSGNTSQRRAGGVSSSRSSGGSSGSSYSGGGAGVSSGSYSGGTISTNYISSDSNFSPVSNANELSSSNAADVTQSVGLAASTILVLGLVDRDIANKDIDENDNPNKKEIIDTDKKIVKEIKNVKSSKVATNIDSIEYINSDGNTNEIIENIKYSKDGYGLIGSRHVISCDKSYGNVGDIITINKSDGTKIECVIGNVTAEKNKINFYVDKNNFDASKGGLNIAKNSVEIVNKGKISSSVISRTKLINDMEIEVLGEEKGVV